MANREERNTSGEWARFLASHAVGDVVVGTVSSVVSFGAFIALDGSIEGLLHESETTEPQTVGTKVRVRIADVDVDGRRMSLAQA